MSRNVLLLGGGGHGLVVLDALLSSGVAVTGILDSKLNAGDYVFSVPVMGGDEVLDACTPADASPVNGLGANPCVGRRREMFERLRARGFAFHSVRHPSALIGRECLLGEGSQIMAGAVLQNRVRIGDNGVVNTRASIDHDCVVGTHAFVAPGVVLCGNVLVGESTFVGAGAVVLPAVKLAARVVVGAGAVVTHDVPEGWIVAGNPAVKIGARE